MRPDDATRVAAFRKSRKAAGQKSAPDPAPRHKGIHIKRINFGIVTKPRIACPTHARHPKGFAPIVFCDINRLARGNGDRVSPARALSLDGHAGKQSCRQDQRIGITP